MCAREGVNVLDHDQESAGFVVGASKDTRQIQTATLAQSTCHPLQG